MNTTYSTKLVDKYQTIPGDVLDPNDHDVSVGDEIVCSIRVEDIFQVSISTTKFEKCYGKRL